MIDVYTVPISKAQFRQLPKEVRAIIFVSGHVMNQIGVLMKLTRFSLSRDPEIPIEGVASATQTQIILRCFVGVLVEACAYFEDRGETIERYLDDMHEEGRAAYLKIKESFDHKSLLRLIRHNYLYHYPNDKNVERAFNAVPEDQPWEWYFSTANTNTLYFSCELVLGRGLMNMTKEPTEGAAFGVIMAQTKELVNLMQDFLMRLIEVIGTRHLGNDIFKPQERTTIANAPVLGEFWLPFFAENPTV